MELTGTVVAGVAPIVATAGVPEVQLASNVISCCVASEKLPTAVKEVASPWATEGLVGDIFNELMVAVVTVTVVLLLMVPLAVETVAVTRAVPAATPLIRLGYAPTLKAATPNASLLHVTLSLISRVNSPE